MMKKFLLTIVFGILVATSYGQTIKTLGFNTTNGQIVANTGTNTLTLTNLSGVVLQNGPLAVSEIQDNSGNSIFMVNDQYFVNVSANSGVALDWGGSSVIVGLPISFAASSNAATTRTNLGLGLPALTNDSNVTFLSAVGAAQTIFSVRTNDLSITNRTNATSTGLSFDTEPNARYVVTLYTITDQGAGGNTLLNLVSSNANLFGNWNGAAQFFATTNNITSEFTISSLGQRSILQTFYVAADTNAGSVTLQFRGNSATNTNTIKAGSFIRADRMP